MEQRQFVEAMWRLYKYGKVSEDKVIELCKDGKITEEEKLYILDVK